jgi:sugar transferase (PEP-CTERM/EpsH1 system associated)
MKILWLNAGLLLPLDKGGKLRTWHLMRQLATRHEITYLSFSDPDGDPADIDGMREVSRQIVTVPRTDTQKGTVRFKVEAAAHLLSPLPYAIGKYRSSAFRTAVRELLSRERFDLLVCDFLFPAVNLPRRLPCPSVVFTHNVELEIWRRHADTQRGALARALFRSQARRMFRYESRTLARFDLILTVSDVDRDTIRALYGTRVSAPIHVVPTGVDTEYFRPDAAAADPRHLVFTGSMDWRPNEDGMLHFVRDILPLIRRGEPGVTLSIVGRAPTPAVRRLAREGGIEVTGRVDDVRPHVARGGVYVVPLRIGGGTRIKIFEAMAMGRAVVSTTIGAEGLPVRDGHDILIADDPRQFADAVTRLMRDTKARSALETAARRTVERYSWPVVAGDLDRALGAAARSEPHRSLRPLRAHASGRPGSAVEKGTA